MKKVLSVLLWIAFMSGIVVNAAWLSTSPNPSKPPCATGSWCLAGNSYSDLDFIGTTDATSLIFKTNNAVRMWLTAWTNSQPSVFSTKTLVSFRAGDMPKAAFQSVGSVMFGANNQFQLPLALQSNRTDGDPTATNSVYSSILWWELHTVTYNSNDSSIGWWKNNYIDGSFSFIWWWKANRVYGSNSVIWWWEANIVEGSNSVIPWWYANYAKENAFAAWMYARAMHKYSFVWNDGSVNPFTTTNNSQFLVNASRGVGINTNNTSGATLTVNGTIKGEYKAANWSVGITKVVNLKNAAGKSCVMTITNGIITATSC